MICSTLVLAAVLSVPAIEAPASAQIQVRGQGQRREPPFAPPPITGTQTVAEMTSALDAYLTQLASEDKFAGVVLIAKGPVQIFEKAYGLADRSNNIPMTPATRF